MSCVETQGRRYASMAGLEDGKALTPRELVEDVIRRNTDGTLTFKVDEDQHSIVAYTRLNGTGYSAAWSKQMLAEDCHAADTGLRELLARMNGT